MSIRPFCALPLVAGMKDDASNNVVKTKTKNNVEVIMSALFMKPVERATK